MGIAGALLPVVPATPFLLLTSYFLLHSSPRLNARLLNSKLFGPILVDWQVHGGVRNSVKIKAVTAVVMAVALTIFVTNQAMLPSLVVITLAAVGIGVVLALPAPSTGGQ